MPLIATRASAAFGAGFSRVVTTPYLGPYGAFDSLQSITVPSGGLSAITFQGIPQTYAHLQIRGNIKFASNSELEMQFGRGLIDTGANYFTHTVQGNGTAAGAYYTANNTYISTGWTFTATSTFVPIVIDIIDYANTNKYKTLRGLFGGDISTNGYTQINSGAWASLNPIDTINLFGGVNLAEFSELSLYGVK